MEKTLPEAPSIAECEQELIAAGWVHLHASPFWRAPNGYLFPSATLAWQMLQTGEGDKEKRCGLCGRGFSNNPTGVPSSLVRALIDPEVQQAAEMCLFTREAEREASKQSTNKAR